MPSFVSRSGLVLACAVVSGRASSTPRLFLNGSGSSIDDIEPLLPRFAGSASLATLDHRGLGRSEMPTASPSMADFAADAIDLADHLRWPLFDLVGVSFGGMVALELACTHPDRVRRLGVLCSSAGGAGGASYPLHELIDLSPEERRRVLPVLQDSRFDEEWLASHEGLVERMVQSPSRTPNTVGYRMQMEARRHHDVWSRLPNVTSPTLVASGRFDRIAPPENGRHLAERIPLATYAEYDGGHMFFLQDRRAFSDLESFLSNEVLGGDVDLGGMTS